MESRDLKSLASIFIFTIILTISACYWLPKLRSEAEAESYRKFCEQYDCTKQPSLLEILLLLLLLKSQQHSHSGWHK